MAAMPSDISFSEWTRKVFDRAITAPWLSGEDTDWNDLPSDVGLDYVTRLCEGSSKLLSSYSDAQVNQGLWFVVGSGENFFSLLDPSIAWPVRCRGADSINILFDFLATRCTPHLSHFDEPGAGPLNSICYMFWDIFPTGGNPAVAAHADLDQKLLGVMKKTLQLPSDACVESGLHGLGHWQNKYPMEVEQIVTAFLAEPKDIRPELHTYAERALCGYVL